MRKRRRLGDLYVRGKEFSVDDGTGDPVTIWIQKLNEVERDAILRRSTAAKARYALECEHEESEVFVSTLASVKEFIDRDGMLNIVLGEPLLLARQRVEAQLSADEDGWGKEDKITNLLESWVGSDEAPGLAAAYAEDENDPAALQVKNEIEAFEDDVVRAIEKEKEDLARDWEDTSDRELLRLSTIEVLKRRASDEFLREWNRQQLFYCVREPDDHHKRYFGTLGEVDDLDDQIREFLIEKCMKVNVDVVEGKDSPASKSSSNSSGSTPEVETSKPSGPEVATA